MPLPPYEKLGAFYLGRRADTGETLLYDAKDLVTHAVCVGMTGSGKTGLCIGLLEEAAIDGIPALVIDPKGDIANLLLAFPDLDAASFEPWINPDEARAQGMEPAAFAAAQAELWKNGLAKWDQDGERIARMKAAADFTVYTPGSDAGVPVSVLKSFGAPDEATRQDREAMRDRVGATATSLLALLGVDADPVQSREHILLSTLLDNAWREGEDVDLGLLISRIQQPPVTKIGVMDLDSFYPAKDRFALSMRLNNLLASPGFEAWLEGEALDIGNLLYTSAGKPRVAIFSIAHLADAERMFFVSLLLNQTLAWVRSQSGTTSLRALLYMDEIFGYFPPVANPPSKKPLLTLLKQARAYGVGVVLATQNPVDLDYKGLANTGTWFIGRLQTERDKARVMEGLEGAAQASGGAFDRQRMERLLAGLGKRVFLMNNVHEPEPILFETRWCLSYLRGPLSRAQIRRLSQDKPASLPAAAKPANSSAPVLPPEIAPLYDPRALDYEPRLYGLAEVHFLDDKRGVDETRTLAFTTPFRDDALVVNWADAEPCEDEFEKSPPGGASFGALPPAAAKPKNYAIWSKDFAAWLFRTQSIDLYRSAALKLASAPGESERDFRIRLTQTAREERDAITEKLRARYAPKIAVLEERKRKAAQAVDREKQQARDQTFGAILNAGTSILGAFLGRKGSAMGKLSTAARSATRVAKERGDVTRASETVEAIDAQIRDLNAQFESDVAALGSTIDPATEVFETISVRPKKAHVSVKLVTLAWVGR